MKRLYTIIVALASVCYLCAQEKIYVHKTNGSIEAISLDQLDSLKLVTTSSDLQLTAEKDTVRLGESVSLETNILENSLMDVAWGTREGDIIEVSGSYNQGRAVGKQLGSALVQASCDGQTTTYPLTVIGRATSTGAPKVHWDITTNYVQAGENVDFSAEYDSKKYPVDYTAVWYDIKEVEEKQAQCALIPTINYTYARYDDSKNIKELSEYQRYAHDNNSWSDATQSYVNNSYFSATLSDTLGTIVWDNPRTLDNFDQKIEAYFGANFPTEFKNEIRERISWGDERDYNAYMQVFNGLGLLTDSTTANMRDTMPYLKWMTDSTFDTNTALWVKHFKQYDSVFSTVNFDIVIESIDTVWNTKWNRRKPNPNTGGMGWWDTLLVEIVYNEETQTYDSIWWKSIDTIWKITPIFDHMEYVYPKIMARIDRVWKDSVSYLDLLLHRDGYYAINYKKNYQLNAEYRVYDKKGNSDKTTPHNIVVENQVEKVKIIADSDPIIVRETAVTLQVGKYYTARQGSKLYTWRFPKGTRKAANGEEIYYHIGETTPAITFAHVGGMQIGLEVTINGNPLPLETIEVNVGYNKEAPTLYYATAQGNIMAYKLVNDAPADMAIYSYDLGFYTHHAFNLLFKDTSLYVLDAGKQFYYVNDVNSNLGDGRISVLSKDGKRIETMISNAGQYAFDDPYYGYVEGDYLYYANRSTGIIKLPLSARNQVYNVYDHPYYVQHNTLGYYNNGWAYSAIGGMFGKIKGVWHWTKFYNGNGIFRFQDSDILPAPITMGDNSNKPKDGIMLEGMSPKSFVYVPNYDMMVVHIMDAGYNGVYACRYDQLNAVGSSKNAIKPYAITYNGMMFESNINGNLPAKEGFGSESVGICQMVYDEVNDCVYFAYRNNSNSSYMYPPTGIYSYNMVTGEVTCLIEGVEAYGLTVNNTPSKLF